jgi:choline transport protein
VPSNTNSNSFPIYAAFRVATGSEVAATVFLSMILILGTVTLIAVQQTASRMTWAFARDNALFGSHVLGRMNSVLGVPVWALLINYAITVVIGILIVVSSAGKSRQFPAPFFPPASIITTTLTHY